MNNEFRYLHPLNSYEPGSPYIFLIYNILYYGEFPTQEYGFNEKESKNHSHYKCSKLILTYD